MTSYVFPGQGSQYEGMAKDFYDNFKIAKEIFEEIEDYTSINIRDIVFNNHNDLLNQTNFTQICIFTASMSIFRTMELEGKINNQIEVMFGHSLGEYTALACSKKISLKDCSQILKTRGDLMNSSFEPNKSGMAALIGLSANDIENLIKKNKIDLEVANDNSPVQVVISGNIEQIERHKDFFLKNGVKKYIKLNVSAAFHSRYMHEAQKLLYKDLDTIKLYNNDINIISNYSAELSSDNDKILSSLKKQMANKVRWTESVEKLAELNHNTIIEIGPNKVLSGLIKRISNSFDIKSINNISDLNNL